MKKVFLIACLSCIFLFTSCNGDSQSSANGYTIETTIDGIPDGVRAFLKVTNEKGVPKPKDTAIVQNGRFVFTGKAEFPELGLIYVNGAQGNISLLIENAEVKIEAYRDSLSKSKVSGGKHNQEYLAFIEESKVLATTIQDARDRYGNAVKERDSVSYNSIRKEISNLEKQGIQFQEDYVIAHPKSYVSIMLVSRLLRSKLTTAPKAKVFYDMLPADMKKTRVAEDLFIKITEMIRASVGTKAENFSAPDPEGNKISLNDIKGKVTVVDFWAAWCGPCRKENPNVVKIYEKYHKDGLEIIGVSLDGRPNQKNAKQDWLRAIEQDGLPWHQVSNLDGFRDAIARTYNIRSIPATFIIDEEGTIVAKNLRGAKLEEKIKELLGK
ncbi:redoxin domain-containing protein [Kordia sp.]|uniref:redoxin domain-containing protein n=1 Tax=Kordia sp. TaxID=1965332 RepID=UPI003B5B937D